MASGRRQARVGKQLEREISSLFTLDKVLQNAICPEKRRGLDSSESALASVTDVVITSDLQVAKVYVSIYSDPVGRERAMNALAKLAPYVRGKLARSMKLRLCPEVRFIYDDSYEQEERILKLLKRIEMQERGEIEPPPIVIGRPLADMDGNPVMDSMDDEYDDDDEDDEDEDEDDDEDEFEEQGEAQGFFDEADAEEEPAIVELNGVKRRYYNESSNKNTSFFGFPDPGKPFTDDVPWLPDDEFDDDDDDEEEYEDDEDEEDQTASSDSSSSSSSTQDKPQEQKSSGPEKSE